MTVNVSKPAFNLREKLSELDHPVGSHGAQLMRSPNVGESFRLIGAARRNILINGDMRISQKYAGTSFTNNNANSYVLDRWGAWSNQSSKFSVQRVVDGPTEEGLKYSTKCTSLAATTAGNSDWYGYNYRIEADDISHGLMGTANAKTFTLSFWVKSSVVGTWTGSIRTKGSSPDRSYPFEYTINSANAWEKKSVTFKGAKDGTWQTGGNAEGMCLWWDLGTGSTYHGTPYLWHSDNKTGSKASPFIAVNGATWYITGVQLELGTVATPFDHRSVHEEMARCQRYFVRMDGSSGGISTGDGAIATLAMWTSGTAYGPIFLPGEMRVAPSLADWSNLVWYHGGNTWTVTTDNIHFAGACTNRVECRLRNVTNGVAGEAGWLRVNSGAGYMDFNSEL